MNTDEDVLAEAAAWRARGMGVALETVVRTSWWRPSRDSRCTSWIHARRSPRRCASPACTASLAQDGLDDATLERVRFPAGLDIKARRGDEIAVSILAEIIQTRRSLGVVAWDAAAAEAAASGSPSTADTEPETAIDPICNMTVQVQGALHTYEYEGQMYYFCCGGCRTRFIAEPEKYATAG